MKVCIFGTGAVGGHTATRMLNSQSGDEVSIVARGVMLRAIRERGLTLRTGGKEFHARPPVVTDDPATLPPQDVVLVTVKAHSLPAAAPAIGRLLAPDGVAVFLTNGIPWWYDYGRKGTAAGTLGLLDPDGALWREVRPERTLGCVVLSPNDMVEPGVINHIGLHKLVVGEPDGSSSPRVKAVFDMIKRNDMEAEISADIRRDIWQKLSLNASGSTVTALTRLDLAQAGSDDGLCAISAGIMRETLEVAAAHGTDLRAETDVEKAVRRGRPGQRTSMMQDALAARPMECEALLGQTQAFARGLGIATPMIDIILPLVRGLDRSFRGQ